MSDTGIKKISICSNFLRDKFNGIKNSSFESHIWDKLLSDPSCPKCDLIEFGQLFDTTLVLGENGEYLIENPNGGEKVVIKLDKEEIEKIDSTQFSTLLILGDKEFKKHSFNDAMKYFKEENFILAKEEFEISNACLSNALEIYIKAQGYENNDLIKSKIKNCHELLDDIQDKLSFIKEDQPIKIQEQAGLSVLIMDCSESMSDSIMDEDYNNPLYQKTSRLEIVATAVTNAIWAMKTSYSGRQEVAFMYVYLFAKNVKRLFNHSVAEIFSEFKSKKDLRTYFIKEMKNPDELGVVTNINGALLEAKNAVADFVLGKDKKLKELFGGQYPIMTQSINVNKDSSNAVAVPNVRVFLYSDGGQFVYGVPGRVKNLFKKSPIEELKFDPLMMAYIGGNSVEEKEGISNLRNEASKCPIHGVKQFFQIDFSNPNPENLFALSNIFHMATGNSGFCPECMQEDQHKRKYKKIDKTKLNTGQVTSLKPRDWRPKRK